MRVKVWYSQPDEALLVDRTNSCFNCARCLFKSLYPTVLQVRTFLHITKCNQIMFDFQKHARESCIHKQDPIAPLQHPVIPDSSPIPLARSLSPNHESSCSSSPEELPNISNLDYSPIPDDKLLFITLLSTSLGYCHQSEISVYFLLELWASNRFLVHYPTYLKTYSSSSSAC